MQKNCSYIECPYCEAEYLPAEIFVPKAFFGSPKYIQRDVNHKILDYSDEGMDMQEWYICDYCNKKFNITAKVTFNSEQLKEVNFETEYTVKIKKDNLFDSNNP